MPSRDEPIIRFDHASFGFPEVVALKDISLSINASEFVGVIGPNGSGKTTLCRAVLGLLAPIEGHLHKIKGLSPMMGKSAIGIISALNDSLLEHLIEGKSIEGIFSILSESINFMSDSMNGSEQKVDELKQKIETNYSKYLD